LSRPHGLGHRQNPQVPRLSHISGLKGTGSSGLWPPSLHLLYLCTVYLVEKKDRGGPDEIRHGQPFVDRALGQSFIPHSESWTHRAVIAMSVQPQDTNTMSKASAWGDPPEPWMRWRTARNAAAPPQAMTKRLGDADERCKPKHERRAYGNTKPQVLGPSTSLPANQGAPRPATIPHNSTEAGERLDAGPKG
jgi:hypothetical protein